MVLQLRPIYVDDKVAELELLEDRREVAGEEALERGGGPEVDFDVREPDSELAKGYAYTAEEIKRTKRPAVDGERAEAFDADDGVDDARIVSASAGTVLEKDRYVFYVWTRGKYVSEEGRVTGKCRAERAIAWGVEDVECPDMLRPRRGISEEEGMELAH